MDEYRRKLTQRGLGIIWFILGLALVASDNAGGWLFFIIGLVWLASTTEKGEAWGQNHPRTVKWLLVALVVVTMLVVTAILLLKSR